MRKSTKKVLAICTSDWHLYQNPPVWRSTEPDWYGAMQRPIDEIACLQTEHDCPILFAGDMFHRWNVPPELINWCLNVFPSDIYSIPGQHDMPNHNLSEMRRSAYTVLQRAGCINDLPVCSHESVYIAKKGLMIRAFPWGVPLIPVTRHSNLLEVAVVHDYVWRKGFAYPGSPMEKDLSNKDNTFDKIYNGRYFGYDLIIYGDNHKSFLTTVGKTTVYNCGPIMRRGRDEEYNNPQVGLLHSDGSITVHYLDTSKDRHLTSTEQPDVESDMVEQSMAKLSEELAKLGSSALDFTEAWKQYERRNKINERVSNIIMKAMEND